MVYFVQIPEISKNRRCVRGSRSAVPSSGSAHHSARAQRTRKKRIAQSTAHHHSIPLPAHSFLTHHALGVANNAPHSNRASTLAIYPTHTKRHLQPPTNTFTHKTRLNRTGTYPSPTSCTSQAQFGHHVLTPQHALAPSHSTVATKTATALAHTHAAYTVTHLSDQIPPHLSPLAPHYRYILASRTMRLVWPITHHTATERAHY